MKNSFSYKNLFHEKQYMKLLVADVISRFGDSIDSLAFSWMVYEITGSPSWLAVIFGVNFIPSILLQPFAGALVETLNKKKTMIICDLARGIVVSLTALLLFLGHLTPWLILIFTFINSSFEAFRLPAGIAVFPKIISKEKYTHAKSLSSSASRISELLGLASAGIIVSFIGTSGALFIDAITFLASAFILSFLSLKDSIKEGFNFSIKSYGETLKSGFLYLKERKIIFTICLVGSLLGIFMVPINTMSTVYVKESLGLGPEGLSIFSIALTLGLSFGSYIFPMINKKLSRSNLFVIGGIILGLSYFSLYFLTLLKTLIILIPVFSIVMFLFGIGFAFLNLSINISFMYNVEENYMARVGSIFNAMASSMNPITSFAIAGIMSFFSLNVLILISGAFCIILFMSLSFNKNIKEL
ncbi:MFS transporter [Clostridium cadaveris]|uniref:MFS transporter n=1 Tax=Clostridium cadaveris TaxID=1529 RepID=UPI0015B4F4F6|nr:MFS transporter [Clostridium cadaveris]NWK10659.1 MFS transporter [Clostridium cadaveris]